MTFICEVRPEGDTFTLVDIFAKVVMYFQPQIQFDLDGMPLGLQDLEEAVNGARVASPKLLRGQCVYDVLFRDVCMGQL